MDHLTPPNLTLPFLTSCGNKITFSFFPSSISISLFISYFFILLSKIVSLMVYTSWMLNRLE